MKDGQIGAAKLAMTVAERDEILKAMDAKGLHSYIGIENLAKALLKLWVSGEIAHDLDTVEIFELCPSERWTRATHIKKSYEEAKLKTESL
jgi:hypothetical protein